MRPLELVLEGFRSYAERTTFNFRGRQLLGVVGPIGSGKSSILDAVAFALFGKTPRIENETLALVRHGAPEARVELLFQAAGSAWRVIRVVRRKGTNLHALLRFANLEGTGEAVEKMDRVRDIDDRLGRVLGLDFTAFCRSVLLAQNQFARFLEASAGDRDRVLKGLFGFERLDGMREAALQRERTAQATRGALATTLAELVAVRAQLPRLEAQLVLQRERLARLRAAQPEVAAIRAAQQLAVAELDTSRAKLAELASVEAALPLAAVVTQLADGDAVRRATRDQAGEELAAAQAAQLEADAAIRAAERAEVQALRCAREADLAAATEALGKQSALRGAALEHHEATRQEAEAARDELARVEREDLAATLRGNLAVGHPCPVCDRPVEVVVQRPAQGDRQRARTALEEVLGRLERAAGAVSAATSGLAAAEERHRRAAVELQALEPAPISADNAAPEVGHIGTPAEARRRLLAAREAGDRARRTYDEAKGRLDRADQELASFAEQVRGVERVLERLCGRLGVEGGLDVVNTRRLLVETLTLRRAAETLTATGAQERVASASHQLAQVLTGLGLEPTSDLGGVVAEVQRGLAHTEGELAAMRTQLERGADLENRCAELEQAALTWARLAEDLKPSRFLRHLLDEERRGLAALASERFEILSGGRYRFTEDGTLAVVDLANAEEQRRLDTLSGGETFLAALALALALAEMVAGEGGRLDAFFLDEGFGSLDAEHLRLALDGIERLVVDAPGRLVVVVSHVAEVRERLDDVIELDREAGTGATIVVRDVANGRGFDETERNAAGH